MHQFWNKIVQIWEWKLCMKEMLIIFHLILLNLAQNVYQSQSACQNKTGYFGQFLNILHILKFQKYFGKTALVCRLPKIDFEMSEIDVNPKYFTIFLILHTFNVIFGNVIGHHNFRNHIQTMQKVKNSAKC